MIDRLICGMATHIYPEGYGVLNDLISYKITTKPLKIIGNGNINGVDLNYFNPSLFDDCKRSREICGLDLEHADFVWIFIGRLVKDKGLVELIEAFEELETNSVLVLLGDAECSLCRLP